MQVNLIQSIDKTSNYSYVCLDPFCCIFFFLCFNGSINILSYFSLWPMQSLTKQWIKIDSHLLLSTWNEGWIIMLKCHTKINSSPMCTQMQTRTHTHTHTRLDIPQSISIQWWFYCMMYILYGCYKWNCLGSQMITLLCVAAERDRLPSYNRQFLLLVTPKH